jgi:FkbM family methyltransferase
MLSVRQKIFIARMLNRAIRPLRRIAGKGMRTRCRRKGIEWDLDLDEGIDLCIYLLGAYEPRTLRAYAPIIRPGDVVFDIGANIGAHTLHLARLVGPAGRVFAFEPTDYAAAKLRVNLALNPELARRVTFKQSFLAADRAATLPTAVASRWPVANRHDDLDIDHLGKPEKLANASALTADDFCEEQRLERLDFVKLDVDGFEHSVLRGFRRSLERFRPCILIEFAPFIYSKRPARDFADLVAYIADMDYVLTQAGSGRPIQLDPEVLRREIIPGAAMNCLLRPSSKRDRL